MLTILLTIIISLIIFGIIFFILIPMRRMAFYKHRDAVKYFFPILGSMKIMLDDLASKGDMLASMRDFSREYPNKKILITNINTRAHIVLRDPEYIKELIHNPFYYRKALNFPAIYPLLGSGLILAEGETWKQHRKIISSAFNYEFLKSNIPVIQQTAQQILAKVTPDEYSSFHTTHKFQQITGEVIGRVFFGQRFSHYTFEGKPITDALTDLMAEYGVAGRKPIVMIFGPKIITSGLIPSFRRLIDKTRRFRNLCIQMVQDRKENPRQSNDLLTLLLNTQHSQDHEHGYSNEDIINEFITFFAVGMETTGHLIFMTLYNLYQHPELLADLKKEREQTYNRETEVTADTLQQMDMLHSVIKETLRYHTPAPGLLPKEAIEDHQLGDLYIRKGDLVMADAFAVFFNEKYFEDAKKFNPARWTSGKQEVDPFVFMPFSGGPRNCIGQHLAIIEAKVVISEFLEKFKYKVPDEYKLRLVSRFLYEPEEDIKLQLEPIVRQK